MRKEDGKDRVGQKVPTGGDMLQGDGQWQDQGCSKKQDRYRLVKPMPQVKANEQKGKRGQGGARDFPGDKTRRCAYRRRPLHSEG